MIRCDLRGSECACTPNECKAARPASLAPVISFSLRDHLITCAAVGIAAFFIAFAVAARMEAPLKIQHLANQENVSRG